MLTAQVLKMWCSLTQPPVNSNNDNFLNKLRYCLAEKRERGELKKIWSYHGIGHCREFLKLTVFHHSMRVRWLLRRDTREINFYVTYGTALLGQGGNYKIIWIYHDIGLCIEFLKLVLQALTLHCSLWQGVNIQNIIQF